MRIGAGFLVSSFDLFNVSDLDLIAQARQLCDRLAVGVLSDEAVEKVTGEPPVVPLAGRLALLNHVRGVSHVMVAEPSQPRFGASAGSLVMATLISHGLAGSDVVLTAGRRSGSAFVPRPAPSDRTPREAVA